MSQIKDNLASVPPDSPSVVLSVAETKRLSALLMRTVGARIREFRTMQGLSVRDLHNQHGIFPSQLSRIENGKQNLTLWTSVRLAHILGVRPWDLYVPREDAPALRPKPQQRPRQDKAALAQEGTAFRKQIGNRIRSLRRLQGMTLCALDEFSGIHQATLGQIELGKMAIRASTVIRIADALGVQPHELYLPREQSGIRPRTGQDQDDDA